MKEICFFAYFFLLIKIFSSQVLSYLTYIFLLLEFICVKKDFSQDVLECNQSGTNRCFIYLLDNQDFSLQDFNFIFKWKDNQDFVDFQLNIELKNNADCNNKWLAIGFAPEPIMQNATVAMCTNQMSDNKIKSFFISERYMDPELISKSNPSIGIENGTKKTNSNRFTCSFSMRKSLNDEPKYKNLADNSHYLLAAYGDLADDGTPLKHFYFGTSDASVIFKTQNDP
jgi:hypothetical protein